MHIHKFQVFDKVTYSGGKFTKLGGKIGEIVARVKNKPTEYVVEFGDASFVMHENFLSKARKLSREEEDKVEHEARINKLTKKLED